MQLRMDALYRYKKLLSSAAANFFQIPVLRNKNRWAAPVSAMPAVKRFPPGPERKDAAHRFTLQAVQSRKRNEEALK